MILGNAYMALFLASKDDGFVPTKALQAYSQAVSNEKCVWILFEDVMVTFFTMACGNGVY